MSKENIKAAIGGREVKSGTVSIARMYPKVKVRVQDFDDQDDDLSFSWNLTSSPGEYQADSPKCIIRVPTSLLPNQELHPTQEPKGLCCKELPPPFDQKDKKSEETDKLSTRAISVTRPRAVLSSPDNDEMFGSKNNKRLIQPSPLRNHNIVQQQRHVEHKIIPSQITPESSIENGMMTGSKDNKRGIQPSPLRNHNMVQQRQVEHKIIPSQTTAESPIGPENNEINRSKNSKRVTQPSPLRSHNVVQKRHLERKSIPPKYATEALSSTRHKPASVVNGHTPSTTKSKTVKQSGMATSSQKAHAKPS